MIEFADAIDQIGNVFAKVLTQLFLVEIGVLDNIVQNGCQQRFVIETHLGQNGGYRERMKNIRFTAFAIRSGMGLGGKITGIAYGGDLLFRQIGRQHFGKLGDAPV
jgi:hypothetical protein